jgi:uncharacterized protein YdcH (DUF465 family)
MGIIQVGCEPQPLRPASGEARRSAAKPTNLGKTIGFENVLLPWLSPTNTERIARMNKAHVDAIASRHAALHSMIAEEEHRPHPDMDLLHRLKKEKLRLKDTLVGH